MSDVGHRKQLLREHFGTLAALYDPLTFYRIEQLGVSAGWQCWEAGAGRGSVASWLAQHARRVVATDVDVAALTIGQAANVDVVRHDVNSDPAPGSDFDLVHTRLLEHVSDRPAALATMATALRSGGWLLAESSDPALQPLACPDESGPAQALANRVRQAILALDGDRGPKRIGRTLPRLLRGAGLVDVQAEVRFSLGGPEVVRVQRNLIMQRGERLRASGLITPEELDRHLADLADENLSLAAFPVVSAWGRRTGKSVLPRM
jgi:SAM-dependent methyltransferase